MSETTRASTVEIPALRFTKDWTNPSDFPTHEKNEEQVRADMQYLFNEIKNWLNETLIPAVQNGAGGQTAEGAVLYAVAQVLTDAQKARARQNIGAPATTDLIGLATQDDITAAIRDALGNYTTALAALDDVIG